MVDHESAVRLASVIAGVEHHEERIRRETGYAFTLTRNPTMVRELHATLTIANRLELLLSDVMPPVRFAVSDIADGALHAPLVMLRADEAMLIRFVRACIKESPIYQIEITADRDIVLWSFVYDAAARKSNLVIVESSVERFRRAG